MDQDQPASNRPWWRSHTIVLGAILLVALLVRLPYFETIPAADDEILQSVVALQIAENGLRPLVGNDAYAGPFFFYLLAGVLHLGLRDPLLLGRIVVLAAGLLTIALSYGWALNLTGHQLTSALTALFLTTNTHHILINSRLGGTTYLLPLFTTGLLFFLTLYFKKQKIGWVAAAGVAAGLALHSNPLGVVPLIGAVLFLGWRLVRPGSTARRQTGLAMVILVSLAAVTYAPVIVYNLDSGLRSVDTVEERSYLWQTDPNFSTFLVNGGALIRQLNRQMAGIVTGDQAQFQFLTSPSGVYLVVSALGLWIMTRQYSALPVMMIMPLIPAMAWFSSHFGLLTEGRFTTWVIPVLALALAMPFTHLTGPQPSLGRPLLAVIAIGLLLFPLWELGRFFRQVPPRYDGSATLNLSRAIADRLTARPVFISSGVLPIAGVGYVPRTYLIFAGIRQDWLSPDELIGQMYAASAAGEASAYLLDDQSYKRLQSVAPLDPWEDPANDDALTRGFGLYLLDESAALARPEFVRAAGDISPLEKLDVRLGQAIALAGYDPAPEYLPTGGTVHLTLHLQKVGDLPPLELIGFVHLVDPSGGEVVAQDDHLLGRGAYPFAAWRSNEIVLESYTLGVPAGLAPGRYRLQTGIYSWPELERLAVDDPGVVDNIIPLGEITIGVEGENN